MRVALFGPYPVDLHYTRGGVEKVMYSLVEGLKARDDLELHVVSLSDVRKETEYEDGGVWIHHVPGQRRFSLPTFRFLSVLRGRRAIRRIDPDLIHCQESGHESYVASGLPYPTLVSIHAVFKNEGVHYPGLRAKFRYWQFQFLAERAEAGIDLYAPSSLYVCEELAHLGPKLLDVVENPIEQRYFEVPDMPVPGRILFAGTIYPRKGVEVLVEAARILRDRGERFAVHIAGMIADKEYHAGLIDQARTAGLLDGEVVFRGFLTEDELTREYSEASIVCLPSFAETSPMTVQQAMCAGKPVVATTVGGIPHLIADGVHGRLVGPGDPTALADALADVLADDDRRREMGVRTRADAQARFGTGAVAARFVEIYHQLLKGGSIS